MKAYGALPVVSLMLCAFLAAGPALAQDADHTDASGMPTDHSTPAEHAQTQQLNNAISGTNAAVDAQTQQNDTQYQQQQLQYQSQQGAYEAQRENYDTQMKAYEALRDRYRAERAAYHRDPWPHRFEPWILHDDHGLIGSRIQIVNGDRIGTITALAHGSGGSVDALQIKLDNGQTVWLDRDDVRFDRDDGVVMTDLDRQDLHEMAAEHL